MEMQFELCLQSSDLAQSLATMRTFGIKFAQQQTHSEETRNAFARIQTIEDWQAVLDRWYPIAECTASNR